MRRAWGMSCAAKKGKGSRGAARFHGRPEFFERKIILEHFWSTQYSCGQRWRMFSTVLRLFPCFMLYGSHSSTSPSVSGLNSLEDTFHKVICTSVIFWTSWCISWATFGYIMSTHYILSIHCAARKEMGLGNVNLVLVLHRADEYCNFVLKWFQMKCLRFFQPKRIKYFNFDN